MAFTSSLVRAGQKTGVTVTAVAIATSEPNGREFLIQSDPANTTNMLIGNSAAQHVVLTPGQSINLPVFNLLAVFVKMASSTGTVNWVGRD